LTVPRAGWLSGWFGSGIHRILAPAASAVALACVDLVRVQSKAARGWRAIEHLVCKLAEARGEGTVGVVTLSEAVRQLSESSAIRPQRSILRAAA
jgi:hypothetical protein